MRPSAYPTMFGLSSGVYDLYAIDGNGCRIDTIGVVLEDPEPILVELGDNLRLSLGDEVELQVDVQNAVGSDMIYSWSTSDMEILSCTDCPAPMLNTLHSTFVKVNVTDENGCTGEDNIQVLVNKKREIFVPTGFSPNNDDINDNLSVFGKIGSRVLSFMVFDRWGELVYELKDFEIDNKTSLWDGRFRNQEMPGGIYIWKAEVQFIDGYQESFSGETTLIR